MSTFVHHTNNSDSSNTNSNSNRSSSSSSNAPLAPERGPGLTPSPGPGPSPMPPSTPASTPSRMPSSWLREEDVDHALGEFSFVEDGLVDQVLELFDPGLMNELMRVGRHSNQDPNNPNDPNDPTAGHSESGDETSESCYYAQSAASSSSEEMDATATATSTAMASAAQRGKGGGRPQSLDGLSERRRQQILRRRVRNRESMRRMRARCKNSKEQLRQLETALLEKREELQGRLPRPPVLHASLNHHQRQHQHPGFHHHQQPPFQQPAFPHPHAHHHSHQPVQQLALEHEQRQHEARAMGLTDVNEDEYDDDPSRHHPLVSVVRKKLLQLQLVESELLYENSGLRGDVDRFEQALDDVRDHLHELRVESNPTTASSSPIFAPSLSLVGDEGFAWVDRVRAVLPQLSPSYDVWALVRQCYDEVLTASRSAERHLSRANQVFGWRDTRMVNGTWVDFVFSKEFPHRSVQALAASTWNLQADDESVNSVMPQTHCMRVLREVDANTLICARNLVFRGDGTNYCTIYLLLRIEQPNGGAVIAQRTLEPENPAALAHLLGPSHSYVSVFYGLMLLPRTRLDDDGVTEHVEPGCRVKFGGRVGNGTVVYATTWAMDILVAILRWENLCVGPLLQLVSDRTVEDDEGGDETQGRSE